MQLQAEEAPKYDDIFVNMGASHIDMAFFSVLGKYLAESGGPHILNETQVLEKGSLKSFLSGKGYNRCKRIHQLLGAAMEIMHIRAYLDQVDSDDFEYIVSTELAGVKKKDNFEKYVATQEFKDILEGYKAYVKLSESGSHGKTAQFWIGYVQMLHLYHEFTRSIREGDLELYIYCLSFLADYFFAFNHPHYARWLVRYHDNLLKLSETHPEVYTEFKKGCFGIKRTKKNFSRIPIDLTLEQTINGDAASQKTGILPFTNSISARQRWAQSHFIRTKIVSHVFEVLSMTKKEDVSQDLKPNRIRKNTRDLQKLIEEINDNMKPFRYDLLKESLFNIGTGKAAQKNTEDFLLNIVPVGRKVQEDFITSYIKDPERFEQPIPKQKILNFASEGKQYRLRGRNNSLMAVQMVRDHFGSILYLSLQRQIDMAGVLSYPLTVIPLSLCHTDGTMHKTPRSKLLSEIESRVSSCVPTFVDVTIIDAMFFLHLWKELPASFGRLSRFLLVKVCAQKGNIIHFVFDKIITPSIKDCERDGRAGSGNRAAAFQITGPGQKRQGAWNDNLRNDQFKTALNEFLVSDWERDEFSGIIKDKKIYVTLGDKCFMYQSENEKVIKTETIQLDSSHEEADSKMIFHLMDVDENKSVVIRTNDTDVLVIALACLGNIPRNVDVWLELGVLTKSTLRYVHVNHIFEYFGESLCKSLPALHTL